MTNPMRRLLFCGTAAITLGCGAAAQAAAAAATEVQEVIVTANKRAERLEDVPMSVTALSPAAMDSRGVKNLQDISQAVVGVQVNFSGAFTQPSVRGVSSLTTGVGFENNVALYIDGFYQDDTSTINADLANLQSIQVLKGPQGTLYGRNATGGAFLITTLAPSKTLTGKIEGSYGNFNDRKLSAYLSGPITDRVRFSIAGYARKSDGYYKLLNGLGVEIGDAAPTHSYSVRAKLQADVTDDLTATVAYNYIELKDGRGLLFNIERYRSPALPAPVGRLYQPRTYATNHSTEQVNIVHEATLTLAYKTPIGTLTSYTGASHRPITTVFDFDGSVLDLSFSNVRYAEDNFQEGIDYSIDAIKNLDLVVGATYWGNRVKARFSDSFSANTLRTRTVSTSVTDAYALFVDATYHVNDQLTVNVGGRYSNEKKKNRSATILFPSQTYSSTPVDFALAHDSFSDFSPRLSVRYELAPRTNVYASVTRGFRTGLVQTIPSLGQILFLPIRPEKITAYEVGYKTAMSNLQFSTAAYYYDYKDIQVGITVPNPLAPASPINVVANAPKAEVYGVEAQATWTPVEHFNIDVGAAYTHARYTKFANATGNGLNSTTGLNVTGQIQDWSGQQMARAPTLTAVLGADYEFQDVLGGSLTASGNVKYTSSYVTNNPSLYGPLATPALQKKQRYRQPSYSLVNASLTWTDASKHYKAGVYVNNLFDKDYHLSLNGGAFGDYGTWASPRTYGATLGYNF